jgi:hypothetical protein
MAGAPEGGVATGLLRGVVEVSGNLRRNDHQRAAVGLSNCPVS